MAFRHGKRTGVVVDTADLTRFFNDSSSSHEVETAEATTYGQDSMSYIIGKRDGTISLEGIFDGDTDAVDDILHPLLGVEDSAYVFVQQGYPSTDSGNGPGIRCAFCKGEAISYEVDSPLDDVVAVSFEAQADGGLYNGVILHNPDGVSDDSPGFDSIAGLSSTFENDSVDNGASTSDGYVAQLHVMENDHDGDLVLTIEDSPDNSTFATLDTFTTVPSGTTTVEQIVGTGTVNRYVRLAVDASASTSGLALVSIGFARLPNTLDQTE